MPSSRAAAVKLPSRAAASKARTAVNGGGGAPVMHKASLWVPLDIPLAETPRPAPYQGCCSHNVLDRRERTGGRAMISLRPLGVAAVGRDRPRTSLLVGLIPALREAWNRRPQRLDPSDHSEHWRRDLGLWNVGDGPRHGGLVDWRRHDRG